MPWYNAVDMCAALYAEEFAHDEPDATKRKTLSTEILRMSSYDVNIKN